MDLNSPNTTPLWLGLTTLIFLVILSWLYQFRGLSKMWVAISLPVFFGIEMAILWKEHIILGFIYGALIGLVTVPVALSIKPKHQPLSEQGNSNSRSNERNTDAS
ncbi:MAG: hypothetical protein D6759_19755 [Chloroflexi bacterium]|nr:MAG: hypothetical protein D6759_19755 [Chloroflexota bacterium]